MAFSMIRLVLAHTQKAALIHAAAKAAGLGLASCPFGPADLAVLKAAVLLVFDADAAPALTPDMLQHLRRTGKGGVSLSPAIVFCAVKEIPAWRTAGVIALEESASAAAVERAVKAAISNEQRWIANPNYVGPDRRSTRRDVAFGRRSSDAPANDAGGETPARSAVSRP